MATEVRRDVRPILLFFSSATSGPSRRMEAFLDQVLQARRNHQTFRRETVDVDQRADLAERFGVTEVPTIVVVDSGRVVRRIVGRVGVQRLREQLDDWLQ
jgi:thioredoxin-like negative regulator of GroEL